MGSFNPSTNTAWSVANPIFCLGSHETICGGTIVLHPATAPTQAVKVSTGLDNGSVIGGSFWSVSYIATGRFLVTLLANAWQDSILMSVSTSAILAIEASLQLATAANLVVEVGPVNVAAGTIEFDVIDPLTGALTNPASNAGDCIHWKLRQNLGGPKSIVTNAEPTV